MNSVMNPPQVHLRNGSYSVRIPQESPLRPDYILDSTLPQYTLTKTVSSKHDAFKVRVLSLRLSLVTLEEQNVLSVC
jgi:hypothetical protein